MKTSERGLALIKEFEGLSTECYADVGGKATIGYGHLCKADETFPKRITEGEATALLCTDLEFAEACVEGIVDVVLTQNQYDALIALIFNIGCGAFTRSTLLRKLNHGDYHGARDEFQRWCRVNGKEVSGLLRRRIAEQLLFSSPDGAK